MKIVFSIHFLTSLVEAMQQVILAISGQKSWQRMLMNSLKRVEELDLNHPMISGGIFLKLGEVWILWTNISNLEEAGPKWMDF